MARGDARKRRRQIDSHNKYIGTYIIGYDYIRVYARPGGGGSIRFLPEDKNVPTMEIGISQNTWKEVVAVAVHEAFEYAVSRQNLRYNLSEMTPPFAHDSYIFIMDHARFHECCARVGEFLADVLPPLATEYRRHIKEEKRKEKAKDAGTEAQQARDSTVDTGTT